MKKLWLLPLLALLMLTYSTLDRDVERIPASIKSPDSCSALLSDFLQSKSARSAKSLFLRDLEHINLKEFHAYTDNILAFMAVSTKYPDLSRAQVLERFYHYSPWVDYKTVSTITRLFFTKDDVNELINIKDRRGNLKHVNRHDFNDNLDKNLSLFDQVHQTLEYGDVSQELEKALQVVEIFYSSQYYEVSERFKATSLLLTPSNRAYLYSMFLYSSLEHLAPDEQEILKYLIFSNINQTILNSSSYAMNSEIDRLTELLPPSDIRHLNSYSESEDLQKVILLALDSSDETAIKMQRQYIKEEKFWKDRVVYLRSDKKRLPYLLKIGDDGKLYGSDGNLFDTSTAHAFHSEGKPRAIFVISKDGKIYQNTNPVLHKFHHSSFLAGEEVFFAGEIEVRDGIIKVISGASGHYRPPARHYEKLYYFLKENGIYSNELRFEFR